MSGAEIVVLEDAEAVAQAAARLFAARAGEAIGARGAFRVALSGGSTPERLFQILADEPHRSAIEWGKVHLYWGDERCAKPDDPMSNYGAARRELISRVAIPEANVFRMRGEANPAEAAEEYEAALRRSFATQAGETPRFDLVFLGVGPDGHTASLFPETEALAETKRWVAANYVPKLQAWRVTLTFPILNAAAEVAFLAVGEGKQAILKSILEGDEDLHPAQRVRPASGRLVWIVDKAAAARLECI